MKLKIETTAKGVEVVNFLLSTAMQAAINSKDTLDSLGLSIVDLKRAERFRRAMVKALLNNNAKQV
jgi:hypothetical protein